MQRTKKMTSSCRIDLKLFEAESVIGQSHIASGLPNQDAVKLTTFGGGCIFVIADGVGSDVHAEFASQAAVEAVTTTFLQFDDDMLTEENIREVLCATFRKNLAEKCAEKPATTCLFCAHLRQKGIFLGQIGDGLCCGYRDGEPFVLSEKESAFTNVVVPLTWDCPPERWKILKLKETAEMALMLATDGIADDILPGKEADFARYLMGLIEREAPADRKAALKNILLHWETPKSFDDKTVALYHFCILPEER